jgi:hypothetical protein
LVFTVGFAWKTHEIQKSEKQKGGKEKEKLIIEMDTVKTAQSREVVGWFGRGI